MDFSPFSFVRQSMDPLCQAAKQCLRQWTKPDNHDPLLAAAMDLTRSKRELLLENMLLHLARRKSDMYLFGYGEDALTLGDCGWLGP